jgi:excisionase family DNA binding protein
MNIELLSITEAAEMLGVTRQAVGELVRRGRIPASKVGFSYILTRQDVLMYQQQKAAREVSR